MSNHIAHGCRNFKAQTGTNWIFIVTIGRVLNFVEAESSLIEFCKQDLSFTNFQLRFILVTRQDRCCYVYGLEHEGQVEPPRWSVFVKTGKKETVQCSEDIDWNYILHPFLAFFFFSAVLLALPGPHSALSFSFLEATRALLVFSWSSWLTWFSNSNGLPLSSWHCGFSFFLLLLLAVASSFTFFLIASPCHVGIAAFLVPFCLLLLSLGPARHLCLCLPFSFSWHSFILLPFCHRVEVVSPPAR